MAITLVCPFCKITLNAPDDSVGKKVRCQKCQGVIDVTGILPPQAAAPNELIPCGTCKRMIAPTAKSCPGCGAANTWVHPEIQRFIDNRNSFVNTPPFQYTYDAVVLQGTAEVKKGIHAFREHSAKILIGGAVAVLFGIIAPPALAVLAWTVGPLAIVVGLILTGMSLFQEDHATDYVVRFSVDFSQPTPRWSSDDEVHWQEVRTFFLGN